MSLEILNENPYERQRGHGMILDSWRCKVGDCPVVRLDENKMLVHLAVELSGK